MKIKRGGTYLPELTVTTFVAVGTTPATAGHVRLPTPLTTLASVQTPLSQEFNGVTKSLTDNTLTDLFVIDNDNDGEMSGGIIVYTVTVDSGTDTQVESGIAVFSAYNDDGTQNGSITKGTTDQIVSAGTLSVTFARANDAAGQMFRVTADSSLNVASTIRYKIINNSAKAITLQ